MYDFSLKILKKTPKQTSTWSLKHQFHIALHCEAMPSITPVVVLVVLEPLIDLFKADVIKELRAYYGNRTRSPPSHKGK